MIYYISDMHFEHNNVIRYDNRPFDTITQMDEVLINNWNARISDKDTVYVLGDAFFKGEERSLEILRQLKGRKHLIKGNHDRVKGRLGQEWESIQNYAEITDGEYFVVMSHYPMMFYNRQHYGAVMLYGHVHNTREWKLIEKWRQELRRMDISAQIINVGCMMDYMNYTPRTLEELLRADIEKQDRKNTTNEQDNH